MLFQIDPLYWVIMLPVLILSILSSIKVKSTFSKFSKVNNSAFMTGKEVAKNLLEKNGLASTIQVNESKGFLTDHYDPSHKVIRLSPQVYNSTSISAIGVAAHETGHAIQHSQSYTPLMLRRILVPIASLGSNLSWILIILGFAIQALGLIKLGIILFTGVVIFQLITLPVEFNASKRAKIMLTDYGIISKKDLEGINKVLNAAALTYVAAAASGIATLLYFILKLGLLGSNKD